MVDSTVYFDLPADHRGQKISEADLKSVAAKLRDAMRKRGVVVGELIGSSTDLWGFSIDFGRHEILFSVSPNQLTRPATLVCRCAPGRCRLVQGVDSAHQLIGHATVGAILGRWR
jgi:hypothetical protein